MNDLISNLGGTVYSRGLKPGLFRLKPDLVHQRLVILGKKVQKLPLAPRIVENLLAYKNPRLKRTLFGIEFRNPVGLSAGFDKNFELPPLMKSVGFGFMEGGSLTYRRCTGNPRPWFYRLPKTKSIVVYAGLANEGVRAIVKRLRSYPKSTFHNFPLNISVAKTNSPEACSDKEAIADYIGSLKWIQAAGVGSLITLNISCPNTYGGEPFTTPDRLERLLKKVDDIHLQMPLFIKMPSHLPWNEFNALLLVIVNHNVQGVTISNLAKDRGQAGLMDQLPDSVKGNLSGRPTWELSNNLIRQTYKKYGDKLTIIGVGGYFFS